MAFVSLEENHTFNQSDHNWKDYWFTCSQDDSLKAKFQACWKEKAFFRGENHRKTFKIYANKQKMVCSSKGNGPMSFATLKSQQLQITTLDLHKKEIISSQAKMKEEFREPCISLLNYFPWIDSGKGKVHIFSCVCTGNHTRLQWVVASQWPHRWLPSPHGSCNRTICRKSREGAVGRMWNW